MKTKNINIELVRIVAMLFVVMHHYFRHGGEQYGLNLERKST